MKPEVSVLLIDDDEDSYVLARSALSDQTQAVYHVEWVSRADEALGLLLENRHDVCLLDYHLGERTGLDILREARSKKSRVPAILLTAHDSAELDWAAMEAGVVDFLGKESLAGRELERSIRYALENTRHLREMEAQAALLQAVIENVGDGIVISNPDGTILQVNGAYSRISGYAVGELIGRPSDLYGPDVRRTLELDGEWRGERQVVRRDGSTIVERVVLRLVRNSKGQTSHFVSLHSDVTRQRQREKQLRDLAHHDALTGLPNRLLFHDRLSQALFQAVRYKKGAAVLYIDLDNFKPINDGLGHEVGDFVLQEVARRIQACVRKEDTAARLGGDEFAVVLALVEGTDGVGKVAAKIIDSIGDPLLDEDGGPIEYRLGASIGAAVFPDNGSSPSDLLERADQAMYQVKHGAKNGFALFSEKSGVD